MERGLTVHGCPLRGEEDEPAHLPARQAGTHAPGVTRLPSRGQDDEVLGLGVTTELAGVKVVLASTSVLVVG